jgi:DNA polymerase-3 subunit beta
LKFTCEREPFKTGLELVEKALPVRSTIPVINNILMEIEQKRLRFTATNLELDIRYQLEEGIAGSNQDLSFKVLLPPKIVNITRHLPAEDIIMEYNEDHYRLNLSSGPAKFTLYGADPSDFPQVNEGSAAPPGAWEIAEAELKQILRRVIFALSTDETRPAFNGVLFVFEPGEVTLTASDTYRLVVKKTAVNGWNFPDNVFLVPGKALRELMKILGDGDRAVKVFPEGKKLVFSLEGVSLSTRLLEERYPDVREVIPQKYETRIQVERKLLEDSVVRASLLSEGINQAIRLQVKEGELEVSVSSETGRMEETLAVEQEGQEVEIYVNSRFLIDFLKSVDSKSISMDFNGKNGPIVIRPLEDDGHLYMVLPIKME